MKRKVLALYSIILATLLGGLLSWALMIKPNQKDSAQTSESNLLLPDFQPELIDHIHIRTRFGALNIRKAEKYWRIEELQNYPASSLAVANLLQQLNSLSKIESIAIEGAGQLEQFGLISPLENSDINTGVFLKLSGKNKYQLQCILGHILDSGSEASKHFGTNFDGHRYLKLSGENTVTLVDDTLGKVNTLKNLWIDNRFFKDTSVQQIEYVEDGKPFWILSRENPDAPLSINLNNKNKSLPNISNFIGIMISSLWLDDFPSPSSTTSIPQSSKRHFEITTFEGACYRIHIGSPSAIPEEEKIYLGAANGMLIPASFETRREISLEEQPGDVAARSLQRASGIPLFNQPYLVNAPALGRLFLTAEELVLFDQVLKNETN